MCDLEVEHINAVRRDKRMHRKRLKKIVCMVLTVAMIGTTFVAVPAFAEDIQAGQNTSEAQTENNSAVAGSGSAEAETPDKASVSSAETQSRAPLKLSAKPVTSDAAQNTPGQFAVKFTGAWLDPAQQKKLTDAGWTLTYELKDQNDKVLTKVADIADFVYKIENSGTKYKLVCTAEKQGETAQVFESAMLSEYRFLSAPTGVSVKCPKSDNNVTIKWKKVSGASGYLIYRTTSKSEIPAKQTKTISSGKTTSYVDKNRSGKKTYYYYVRAIYKGSSNGSSYQTVSESSARKSVTVNWYLTCSVRTIKWYTTTKTSAKLYTSKTGGKSKGTLKKGTYVRVTDKYPRKLLNWDVPKRIYVKQLKDGKSGKVIRKGWVRWKDCKTVKGDVPYSKKLDKNNDWTKKVKEKWVNKKKYGSKTRYLIWISQYTQHVTIFKGRKGHWKVYKSFRCCSGKFQQPTPKSKSFTIHKHKMKRTRLTKHGNPYYYTHLSFFTGGDSFHTICWYEGTRRVLKGMSNSGQPNTRGCVRLDKKYAVWIYKHIPNGTKVISY